MRIAVVGAGISGLAAAYFLRPRHEVLLFEQEPRAGGHAWTWEVASAQGLVHFDVGFLVYNEQTYPIFTQMLRELAVPTIPSEMSFSVQCRGCRFEYASHGLRAFLGGARGWWRPQFPRMLADVLRFYRLGQRWLESPDRCKTLGEFLAQHRFSQEFARHFILPMTAAIWSAPKRQAAELPLGLFLRFFANHGLLSLRGQPQWRTIRGGSREYVNRLLERLGSAVHLGARVERVTRSARGVRLQVVGVGEVNADAVVLALHSDQALRVWRDASPEERAALRAIPYQRNAVVVHSDPSVMPSRRLLWASWNYHAVDCHEAQRPVQITYWINRLQSLPHPPHWFVSLNCAEEIDQQSVLGRFEFDHPLLSHDATWAQQRLRQLSGRHRVFFAGAYLGYGFHEDGARAGWEVAAQVDRWCMAA